MENKTEGAGKRRKSGALNYGKGVGKAYKFQRERLQFIFISSDP